MKRFQHLHNVVRPGSTGIEIGPWRHPVAPKRDGYQTLVVDILDTEGLRRLARERDVPAEEIALIEEVDIVGDASRLLDLVRGSGFAGRVQWIVSCHNFEHLPDPVRFLCDCEKLLEPGGTLAMIVPDKRYTLDRFQPAATVADMLHTWIAGPGRDDPAWGRFRQQALAAQTNGAAPTAASSLLAATCFVYLSSWHRSPREWLLRVAPVSRVPFIGAIPGAP